LKPASELLLSEKSSAAADHCFIQMKQGKRSRNLTVFESYGCSLLQEARRSKKVILLDEIGGVELLSKSFMKELYLTLNQPQKIIGVCKSDKNYQRQKQHTLESLDIDQQRETLKEAINAADGQIRTLTEQNHQMVEAELRHFLTS
jgi:nucleoside-triphosphatase